MEKQLNPEGGFFASEAKLAQAFKDIKERQDEIYQLLIKVAEVTGVAVADDQ